MITVYTWYIVVYALHGVERSWTADVYVIHYSMIPGIMHGFPREVESRVLGVRGGCSLKRGEN